MNAPATRHARPAQRALALFRVEAAGLPGPGRLAAVLTQCLAAEDTVSALDDGSCACLLSSAPSREHLCRLAWVVLDALATASRADAPWPGMCIGIARWPDDGISYKALLHNAGAAMYRARRQKSGYAFFDEHADVWDPTVEARSTHRR